MTTNWELLKEILLDLLESPKLKLHNSKKSYKAGYKAIMKA